MKLSPSYPEQLFSEENANISQQASFLAFFFVFGFIKVCTLFGHLFYSFLLVDRNNVLSNLNPTDFRSMLFKTPKTNRVM